MRTIKIEARETISEKIKAGSIAGAVSVFRAKHPNAIIEEIAGREFIGFCDGCFTPILSGAKYATFEDATLCSKCAKSPTTQ